MLLDLLNLARQSFNCVVYLLPGYFGHTQTPIGLPARSFDAIKSGYSYTVSINKQPMASDAQLAFREDFPQEYPGIIVHDRERLGEQNVRIPMQGIMQPHASRCLWNQHPKELRLPTDHEDYHSHLISRTAVRHFLHHHIVPPWLTHRLQWCHWVGGGGQPRVTPSRG